jgi:hypothetical protein
VTRFFQLLLIVSTLGLSWLLMMAVHECGHVLHGWWSGARLAGLHLPLCGFSRTDFALNPHPLFVAWGGPLWGCLFPLAVAGIVRIAAATRRVPCARHVSGTLRVPSAGGRHTECAGYLAAWFAGFCLVANGAYLLGGAFLGGGGDDAGVILQSGGHVWQLVAFGLPAIAAGLYLWHGLGPHFGLGEARGKVDRQAAVGVAIALACVIMLLMLLQKSDVLLA